MRPRAIRSRLLVDGPIIVASILLAFAIDAWWDGLQRRQEEQRLLRNLLAEFIDTRTSLEDVLRDHRGVRDRAVALAQLGASQGTYPLPTFDPPIQLVNLFTTVFTFHAKTGVLDGALATGRLDLITNDGLRSALAGWPRTLGEFTEEQDHLWDLAQEARPVLASAVPISDLVLSAQVLERPDRPTPSGGIPTDIAAFLTTPVGQNLSALRAQFEGFYVRDGEELLATLSELIGLIEAELR